ncbi:MAG: phytanoyl-CoA dioxygenase [Planctomycetes bacterium]|nr:phytanoyl-CoA dioxygenase [Planctomycetota bacterium]
MPSMLTAAQLSEFHDDGFTVLRSAFSAEIAARCRAMLWAHIGLAPDRPQEWTQSVIHVQQSFADGPFREVLNARITGAYDDLLGVGRWQPIQHFGWWPITFPGHQQPPWHPHEGGWHVDGQQFHHHLDSPDQGLLPLFLFSDIRPGGGGTAISLGSHLQTARILRDAEPAGLDVNELARRVSAQPRPRVLEATGSAGDIYLLHPFMLHTRSANTGSDVRFICNPCLPLVERMDLDPASTRDHSPLERSIMEAISRVPTPSIGGISSQP